MSKRKETDFNRGTLYYGGRGYCSWGWFEDNMLNTHFGFIANKEGTLQTKHRSYIRSFSTNTKVDSNGEQSIVSTEPNTCRFNRKHLYTISRDIILPHKHYPLPDDETLKRLRVKSILEYQALKIFHQKIDDNFEPFKHPTENKGIIRNFVFSADFLIEQFSHGVRSLESALNSFWSRVTSVYGGYWNFEIVQSQNTNGRIGVIDNFDIKNRVESVSCFPTIDNKSTPKNPNKNFEFSVYSLNSLMSDFSVDVSLDSKLVTQAIYHTNKDISITGNSGMNMPEYLSIKALSTLNNAIITEDEIDNLGNEVKAQDAVLQEITTPYLQGQQTYAKGSTTGPLKLGRFKEVDEVTKQIEVAVENANRRIQERDTEQESEYGAWWPDENDKAKSLIYLPNGHMFKQLKKGMLYYLNKSEDSIKEIDPIVPLSVSFTISGIGGIRIGDCFAIDYLPEVYRQYSVFQVSKITHTVGADGWKTAIDGLLRIDVKSLNRYAKSKEGAKEKRPSTLNKLQTRTMLAANDAYNATGKGLGFKHASSSTKYNKVRPGDVADLPTLKGIEDEIYQIMKADDVSTWDEYKALYPWTLKNRQF